MSWPQWKAQDIGMCCNCPHHREQRTQALPRRVHVTCIRNSRRLNEAWPFLERLKEETAAALQTLTAEDCEGDEAVYMSMVAMSHRRMSGIDATGRCVLRGGTGHFDLLFEDDMDALGPGCRRHTGVESTTERLWQRLCLLH